MKNRWIISGLIAIMLMTGCQTQEASVSESPIDQRPEQVEGVASKEMENGAFESNDSDEDYAANEMPSFEKILGKDIEQLEPKQVETLRSLYDEIAGFELAEDGSNEDAYYEVWDAFDLKRIEYGLDVPFYSFTEVAQKHVSQIKEDDFDEICNLDEAYIELTNAEDYDEEAVLETEEKIQALFDQNGLPGQEIITQVQNQSVHYALFDVKKGKITFSDDSMEDKSALTDAEKDLYNRLWAHVVKIVPKAYMPLLTKYEVNTDGYENVMAHVVQEKDDYSQWRLAIDVKDAINPDGSFSDEFTNTVIHEFAHVMTLHKGQLQGEVVEDESAYETDEGRLKTTSYLNKFYQRFWKDLIEEHKEMTENSDMSVEDGAYAFFEKYEDQFVTDYAATNPAEDIAETYRVFVTEDKPTGASIRDQKILFMYDFDELVLIRKQIRSNLGLEK